MKERGWVHRDNECQPSSLSPRIYFQQYLLHARPKAARGEQPAGDVVRRGGVQPDLLDADLAESLDGEHHHLPRDAFVAIRRLDPQVVDEPVLLEPVDRDLALDRAD